MPRRRTVALEPLAESDARDFLAEALELLVTDLASTNDWSLETARKRAREMERSVLPHHEATVGHSFMSIVAGGESVGRVWLGPMPDGRPLLYVWEIIVDGHRRGEGFGTEAITEVLRFARDSGRSGVALTVWDTNPGARRLYERMGFTVESFSKGRSLMVHQAD